MSIFDPKLFFNIYLIRIIVSSIMPILVPIINGMKVVRLDSFIS